VFTRIHADTPEVVSMLPFLLAGVIATDTLLGAGRDSVPRPRPAADTAVRVKVGAFIDGYYAWDTGRPRAFDRAYTTQPARHNEFNINLAFVEATLRGERIRGRVALQAGTSVQSNYAAEPRVGSVSGGDLMRSVQEATVGVRVHPRLWVDGGVYFSYIGLESWISRDNPTYTRSLIADYTPYYLSGVKLTWQVAPQLVAQAHVMNGWQNVSESNADKAVGTRLEWRPHPTLSLGWGTFIGNQQPDSVPARPRLFNQVTARWLPAGWDLSATLDLGRQRRPTAGSDHWTGSALVVRRAVSGTTAVVARVEHLFDRGQVLVVTGTRDGFRTTGASLGLDKTLDQRVLWRTEARAFRSGDAVWPQGGRAAADRRSALLVTSLALTL
jgi:hypothetical protein